VLLENMIFNGLIKRKREQAPSMPKFPPFSFPTFPVFLSYLFHTEPNKLKKLDLRGLYCHCSKDASSNRRLLEENMFDRIIDILSTCGLMPKLPNLRKSQSGMMRRLAV